MVTWRINEDAHLEIWKGRMNLNQDDPGKATMILEPQIDIDSFLTRNGYSEEEIHQMKSGTWGVAEDPPFFTYQPDEDE